MEIVITGRHTEVSERFRTTATEKLSKISQLAPRAQRVDVELSHERNPRQAQTCEKVEITVRDRGPVIRAEARAEDPLTAMDLAVGRLLERLRRTRDRRKVHHGRQTPASVRLGAVPTAGLPPAQTAVAVDRIAPADPSQDGEWTPDGWEPPESSPVVIRTKEHHATPMTLDQALYEMELVGHEFFLFVDADCHLPSVVYRRRGWNYGVIRLQTGAGAAEVAQAMADSLG